MISILPASATIFIVGMVALATSLLLARPAIWLAHRFGLMDMPNSAPHKQHSHPTPLAGGITLVFSMLVLYIVFGLWQYPELSRIFLAALIIFATGIIDDAIDLKPRSKLAGQILAAGVLISLGIQVNLVDGHTLFSSMINIGITMLWLVGITNAVNLVDSMDGLAISTNLTAAFFFVLGALESGEFELTILGIMILGVGLGLLFYNSTPSRLFLGDSGTMTLGFLLASLAIVYDPPNRAQLSSWFVPILFLGLPIFDTTLVVISRFRRGVPFFKAERNHTYHRLADLGLAPVRAVLAMVFASFFLGGMGFLALTLPPIAANSIFGMCLIFGAVAIWFFDFRKKKN